MKHTDLFEKGISFSIFLITFSSVNSWTDYPIGNTVFWWSIYAFVIFLFVKGRKFYGENVDKGAWVIPLFYGIVVVSFIHGVFIAEYYWDWKELIGNAMVFSLPLAIYTFSDPIVLRNTLKVWLRYAVFLFPFFLFVLDPEAYGRYFVPLTFLTLFFFQLPNKWKVLCIFFVLFVIIKSPGARSNIIKSVLPIGFSFFVYLKNFSSTSVKNKIFHIINITFLLTPAVFIIMAISVGFNVFDLTKYLSEAKNISGLKLDISDKELSSDTRTLLYREEFESALRNNYWLFGRSMARGYDSIFFAIADYEVFKDTNRFERQSCEVSILNVFNYFGIVGVISYFLIFCFSSFSALKFSDNIYIKILGAYVSFRWMFAFIEDFSRFDLNYLFLWIAIGMCFSRKFLKMNNYQFEEWVKSIFQMRRIVW